MEVDGKEYYPVSGEEYSTFYIEIPALDTDIPILAETLAMSEPHLIEYTLKFDSATIKEADTFPTLAVVVGRPKNDSFFIEKPILKVDGTVKRVIDDSGKYAKTECRFVKDLGGGLSLISVTLHTGRTHQIRVHLSSVGLPLYADSLYGTEVKGKTYILHASGLTFIHPFTNKKIEITSTIDIDTAF
jgi:hypothetical protein